MQFAFALENSFGPVAEYVRGLEAGLRTLGHDVAVVQDIAALPPGARPVLDGRLLPALPSERRAAFGQGAIALLHGPGATSHPADGRAQAALRAWLPRFERVVVTGSSAADRLAVELDVPRGRLEGRAVGLDLTRSRELLGFEARVLLDDVAPQELADVAPAGSGA